MGLFGNQLSNVVEWTEYRDDVIFWKWHNDEIKKGSKLIIRQGQDAIFTYNGKIEGVFSDPGSFDIASDIIPFLSTLKGFKFGFNSGIRAEVVFINTKEMTLKWGTKNNINIPTPELPGGMPIRAFGTMNVKVDEHQVLIEKIAGIKDMYTIEELRERIVSVLDQLVMKWITKEGKDLYNLQANAYEISKGLCTDLDMEMRKIGIAVTGVVISNVSYPEQVQKMVEKAASQSMVGDMNRYQQMGVIDSMDKPNGGGSTVSDMAGMAMGMAMGQQMVSQMTQNQQNNSQPVSAATPNTGDGPKFCPNCGEKAGTAKFCSNCGQKLRD